MLYTRDGVRDWIHADVIVRSLAATVRETRYIYQSSLISAIQYYQESAVYTYAAFLQLTRPHSNENFCAMSVYTPGALGVWCSRLIFRYRLVT
jgi:hypothetical protein